MPRFTLSENQAQFDTLFGLLNRPEVSVQVWDLIRMLATNRRMYEQVLCLKDCRDAGGKIDWKAFFEGGSIY